MPAPEQPDNTESLLDNIASLDTARMTLRWALERIRGLERAYAEVQELLQKSYEGRQKAEGDLGAYKKSVEERHQKLAEKERFVSDMQRVLNDLFKGEVDVAEFVRRKTALEEERAQLEAKTRRRLEDAETAHKSEVSENSKRLADMEGVYSGALAEAQRRFHAELGRLELEHAAALKGERERYDQYRGETHRENARTAEEYQRGLLVLEHEYAGKRREMTEDLDRLKARLAEESKVSDAVRAAEAVRAADRWGAERAALEARLAERETRLTALERTLQDAEAAYFSRDDARRKDHAAELEALRGVMADAEATHAGELGEARAEVARRETAFQAERLGWVEERNALRAQIAAEYEGALDALRAQGDTRLAKAAVELEGLRERLRGAELAAEAERGRLLEGQSALRRADAEKFLDSLRQIEARFHERELEARQDSEGDLDALRKHFEEALARQRQESRKEIESHAQEVQSLRARLRQQQEELAQSLEAQERRRLEDLRDAENAHAARHAEDVERLRREGDAALSRLAREHEEHQAEAESRLAEAAARGAADREELIRRQEAIRDQEAQRFREALRQQVEAARGRELAHARQVEASGEELRRLGEASAKEREELLVRFEAATRRRLEAYDAELEALRASHHEAMRKASAESAELLKANERALAEAACAASNQEAVRRLTAEQQDLQAGHREALRKAEADRASLGQAHTTELDRVNTERGALLAAHERALAEAVRAARSERGELVARLERQLDEQTGAQALERAGMLAAHEGELRRLADEHSAERAGEARKREERLAELEAFYAQSRAGTAKDAADQLEELRRHYRRALESLRADLDPSSPEGQARAAAASPIVHRVSRRWPWAAAAALALTASAFLLARRPATAGRDYSIPFEHPSALAWEGDSLWAADWKEQAVYRMSVAGGALRVDARLALPESHVTGLAASGGDLYVADSWTRQIQRWRRDGNRLLLAASWPSPGPQPSALYHDGTNLWSADSAQRRIYRHALDHDLAVLASYDVDLPIIGMWADAERFWSADTANRLIHRHRWDDVLSLVGSFGLRELDDGRAPLSAFAMRGDRVWLGRDGQGSLLSRPLSSFEPRPAPKRTAAPQATPKAAATP